ncbi:MAG: 50S ribosomal protein L25 [Phycisphaerae bacterium]|nr:50S ribosomal protein L25 [Phycisphaerae bacterium]
MATMKATQRTQSGTHAAKRLRNDGKVPGVMYGHGEGTQAIALEKHEVELALLHGERLLEIDLEGKTQNALIKEIQYDTFGQDVLHIDLARVDLDERVELTVRIHLVGEAAGVKDGGVLQQIESEVEIECPVRSIPEEIRHLVTEMKLNDRLHMKDLVLPEGAVLRGDPDLIVASVAEIAEVAEAPAEGEEAAEPEVIGAKPAEDEEETTE